MDVVLYGSVVQKNLFEVKLNDEIKNCYHRE